MAILPHQPSASCAEELVHALGELGRAHPLEIAETHALEADLGDEEVLGVDRGLDRRHRVVERLPRVVALALAALLLDEAPPRARQRDEELGASEEPLLVLLGEPARVVGQGLERVGRAHGGLRLLEARRRFLLHASRLERAAALVPSLRGPVLILVLGEDLLIGVERRLPVLLVVSGVGSLEHLLHLLALEEREPAEDRGATEGDHEEERDDDLP